jgi:hypothetical protein
MSTRTSRNFPAYSAASFSSTWPSWLDASDRGDQNSTTTGCWMDRSITSAWKLRSVVFSTNPPPPPPPPEAGGEDAGAGWRSPDKSMAPGREKFG